MRRTTLPLSLVLVASGLAGSAVAAPQPPQAWLFGSWSGGLFPVPAGMTTQACLSQPVVLFTRDVVLRATLTETTYTQRVVETARTNANGTEFRFTPVAAPPTGGLLGLTAPPAVTGFGCEDPNVLHVERKSDNEISFPGCQEFSYPLVRCGAGK